MRKEIGYLVSRTVILFVLVVVLLAVFGDLASGSNNGSLFIPLVYGGAAPVIPPPFAWGDVEKLTYDSNSKQACSILWPFNCKDVK